MKKSYSSGNRSGRSTGKKFGTGAPWKKSFREKSFGDGDRGRSVMHSAICSQCGKECEVPFKPNGKKPIFCASCFRKNGTTDAGRPGALDLRNPRFDDHRTDKEESLKDQLRIVNTKLDSILKLLGSDTSFEANSKPTPRFKKR